MGRSCDLGTIQTPCSRLHCACWSKCQSMSPSHQINQFCFETLAKITVDERPAQSPQTQEQVAWPTALLDQLEFSGGNVHDGYIYWSHFECLLPLQCKHNPSVQTMLLRPSANSQDLRMPPGSGVLPLEATPKRDAVPPANTERKSLQK